MTLNNYELIQIKGGAITATLINAFSRAISTILKLGQVIGSTIRRSITNTYCIG